MNGLRLVLAGMPALIEAAVEGIAMIVARDTLVAGNGIVALPLEPLTFPAGLAGRGEPASLSFC